MAKYAKFLTFATQKGGSGKSSICALVANLLHHRANKNILVVDADFQQTLKRMSEMDGDPPIDVFTFLDKPKKFPKLVEGVMSSYDYVLIDTPGRLSLDDIQMFISVADAVFVPVVASIYDIDSTAIFLNEIEPVINEFNTPVHGIINKRDRTMEHRAISQIEGMAGLKLFKSYISNRAQYKRIDFLKEMKSEEIDTFYNELMKKI